MEAMELKPERQLKSLWYVYWAIPSVIGSVFLLVLLLTTRRETSVVFSFFLVGFLAVMLLILLWIPAYHRTLKYAINSQAVRSTGGVFWRKHVTIPFGMITHVDVTQGPVERALAIGTIHVQTAGAGGAEAARAELKLVGIRDLDGIKETVMERIRAYRTPGAAPEPRKPGPEADARIMERMLEELSAIRKVLDSR
jgi:membrane protein YdbS with pleckstrin-like domain